MERNKNLPIRDLRVGNWVKIDGRPQEIRSFAAKLLTDDGEYFHNAVYGLTLDETDARLIERAVSRFDRSVNIRLENRARYWVLSIFKQRADGELYSLNKPVKYYHEVQNALIEMNISQGLNYKWRDKEAEDKEAAETKENKEADNGSGPSNNA